MRTRCEGGAQEIAAFATKRAVDGELFAVLSALDPADLDDETGRLLRLTLRDFRRAGVDRDEQTRARLIEISDRQTLLGQEFSRNIRDDVPTVRLRPEQLAGLPQDFIDAHPVDDDGDGQIDYLTQTLGGPFNDNGLGVDTGDDGDKDDS